MATLIVWLLVLPLIFWIGLFYLRLGRGLRRAVQQAVHTASPAPRPRRAEVPQDRPRQAEETALAAARAILHQMSEQPDMPGDERLASVTYAILDAMHRLDELRRGGPVRPVASVN